ncbi:AraC family transcriptional regulator [Lysobacter sp. CAU 1642]|uniref:AraC family transcriptional regulator n=2 Tax=Pseudomarimonas salicorniae TaxID=2933270 RepID=A0ABT0GEM2_9GAMM|nr:AraC family transcriptional regulator [Lysobacter sp. CAU 1642]
MLGISVAVQADAEAGAPGTEVAADLVFAALDLPPALPERQIEQWLVLQPQAAGLREALMLASVAHAAVYLPPALQLGLAWVAQQQRAGLRVDPARLVALGEQLAGWLLALRRLPTSIARARRGDGQADSLARARAAVHACLPSLGGLDAMAAAADLSRGQLNRVLRRGCGLSAGRYRSELRLRRAALLILVDGERCAEAAAAVGYRSGSQFSQEFHQLYGVRPSRLVSLVEALLMRWSQAA